MQESSKFFKQHPKYGKQHLMAENSYHLREMIEQCSRCSLPTGSGTSDQKSENVKSFVTPMPTNDPIFVMIRFIKTPLHYEKLRTGVTPLRSYRNFIVGPTGPNKKLFDFFTATIWKRYIVWEYISKEITNKILPACPLETCQPIARSCLVSIYI